MKKLLLTTAIALASLGSLQAQQCYFGYCNDNICGVGWNQANLYMAEAVRFNAADLAKYAGNKLTGLSFGFGSGINKNITIFIAHNLDEAPFYTQTAKIAQVKHWNDITLDTPLDLTTETGDLYVGFYLKTASTRDFQLGVDEATTTNGHSNYMIAASYDDELWGNFMDRTEKYGNACIRAIISGDNLPKSTAVMGQVVAPNYATPGQPFAFSMEVRNTGCDDITTLDATYQIGNDSPIVYTLTLPEPLKPGKSATINIEDALTQSDNVDMPLDAWVSSVNGIASVDPEHFTAYFPCSASLFERRMVVEEGTGTWCNYCPIGYVAMEYMRDHYTDGSWIGIAVHNDNQTGQEPMHCDAYQPFVNDYAPGFPYATVNRDQEVGTLTSPSWQLLNALYPALHIACYQGIQVLESSLTPEGKIHVKLGAKFAKAFKNHPYALSIVLTEDNLGPYVQGNNYAAMQPTADDPYMAEFNAGGKYGKTRAEIIYNDVARHVEGFYGIQGSLPNNLEAGVDYIYECDIDMPAPIPAANNLAGEEIPEHATDTQNLNVIGLIVDTNTNAIVNGDSQRFGTVVSVQNLQANPDATAPVEYYDLTGRRVRPEAATAGIYIVRQGKTVRKIQVR